MKLASRISSIRRIASNACSCCPSDSATMWRDSFARCRLAGWMCSPAASRTRVTGSCASQSIVSPGWSRRSSCTIATSRQAWPRPIGDETYSARFDRVTARRQICGSCGRPQHAFAKSETSRLNRTGSRACGLCPAPSIVTSLPPVAAAKAAPRSAGIRASSSPWITSTGQRIWDISSCDLASSNPDGLTVSSSVSGVVSSAQPMPSSICFVECGSVKQRSKKNSRKPG